MIDPIAAPLVTKAVEFLFDQGRLFLQDWREHRKSGSALSTERSPADLAQATSSGASEPIIATKDDALRTQIHQSVATAKEQEIAHLLRLIEVHRGNYSRAKEQEAQWGALAVPPFIANTVNTEGAALDDAIERLRVVIAAVYGKQIAL